MPEEIGPVLDAAAGLTRSEAENAFALSLVRHGRLDPDPLWEMKARQLKGGGPLSLHRGGPGFDALGGMAALKAFCRTALTNGSPAAEAKGVLLLGPGGVGKSSFARALGAEVGRPTLTLDVGALMGGLVGATEENARRALATVAAMTPCVLFVDEVERALAGTSGGANDSGVSARLLGTLLTWLADRPPGVFAVCTSQRRFQAPPGADPQRAVRRDVLPGPARPRAAGGHLGDVPRPVRDRPRRPARRRRRLDRGGGRELLPAGGAAGRVVVGGRRLRRAGVGVRQRVAQQAPPVGVRAVPRRRDRRGLPPP